MKLRRVLVAIILGLVIFACGMAAGFGMAVKRARDLAANSAVAVLPRTSASPASNLQGPVQEPDCVFLPIDHPQRARLNGTRLPLDYTKLQKLDKREAKIGLQESKIRPLSGGRLLVALDNSLYMLDSELRIEWQYRTSQDIFDVAAVEGTGLIYGVAGDGVHFVLDVTSGKQLLREVRNGRSSFMQTVPYTGNTCLLVENRDGYRDNFNDWQNPSSTVEVDGLSAWRGTRQLWTVEFPPDAELLVSGRDLYAVTKTDAGIYVRKLNLTRLKKYRS